MRLKHNMRFILLIGVFMFAQYGCAQSKKGFDLSNASIPVDEIKDGGPPKDGIPSIDQPEFKKASATQLDEQTRVLGVKVNGVAKAYPIPIMNYHEIVNDMFADQPVVVTYCPLCGSGIAFDAAVGGERKTFGVSGLLYNSDVLLYDRQTESLWSQIMMQAVAGPMEGRELEMVPTMNTSWGEWKRKNPDTWVLTENTGYERDYTKSPYQGYEKSTQLYFDVEHQDERFHPKEMVVGIEINGKFKAYPFSELEKLKNEKLKDKFQGEELIINYQQDSQSATISNSHGKELPALSTFWFAWYTFHPGTEVFTAK
jgi:hypothetical protein